MFLMLVFLCVCILCAASCVINDDDDDDDDNHYFSTLILVFIGCRKAADQGHPHASYNVALGHIKGIRTDLLKSGCVNDVFFYKLSEN